VCALLLQTAAQLRSSRPGFGGALFKCSRCQQTWYADAAAQREHWPAHRTTCRAPPGARALAELGGGSLAGCVTAVSMLLRGAVRAEPESAGSLQPAAVLAELIVRLEANDGRSEGYALEVTDISLHLAGRALIFVPNSALGNAAVERLWASPGMAELFFGGAAREALLGPVLRDLRMEFGTGGIPYGEYDEYGPDGRRIVLPPGGRRHRALQLFRRFSGAECVIARRSAAKASFVLFNSLLGAASHLPPPGKDKEDDFDRDGTGKPRNVRPELREAATRLACELWLDPWVRAACGDAIQGPGASFVYTHVRLWRQSGSGGGGGSSGGSSSAGCKPDEIAPAVPVAALLTALLCDMDSDNLLNEYNNFECANYEVELLLHLAECGAAPWEATSDAARARAALDLANAAAFDEYREHDESWQEAAPALLRILESVLGSSEALRRRIVLIAAEHGEVGGPGPFIEPPGESHRASAFFASLLAAHKDIGDSLLGIDMASEFRRYKSG